MSKCPKTSSMWTYFIVGDSITKTAKCDLCGLKMSYRSTISNLKNNITRKHPTVNTSVSQSHTGKGIQSSSSQPSEDTENEFFEEFNINNPCSGQPNDNSQEPCRPSAEISGSSSRPTAAVNSDSSVIKQSSLSSFVTKKLGLLRKENLINCC